ncbi:MAG: hypothetical protein E7604_08270 [Ruminococcaceae bacterium]|nr:hypothetical protein [Oscillospiraceae bacterium]
MKKFRLLSGILAFLMIFSTFTILPVAAAEEEDTEETNTINYMTEVFKTADEKLATMTEMVQSADGRYSIYVEKYTGEIAYHDNEFGQTLFSNPYNINDVSKSSSEDVKNKLMSQVIVKYLDNDKESTYYSFEEAAEREQIKVKNIKNGVRVEYSIGREETRKLVPRQIEKTRFEEQILANLQGNEFALKKMNAFYSLKDPDDPSLTDRGVKEMMATFPITQKMAVYVFDPYATDRELNLIEGYILENCPLYTYDELDKDHEMTEYEGTNTAPALFKMALEYYLEDGTLRVRFPVNGLRFDDTAYQLTSIEILPYFGCGTFKFDGYLLLPDGSGTIVRFEDFAALSGKTVTGKVYGQDYAFYEISGEHQESVRLPVYGIVENYADVKSEIVSVLKEPFWNIFGEYVTDEVERKVQNTYTYEDKGFFAIIEEGEALASISTETGGRTCQYDNVKTTITPRQRDTYDIADAVSGAGSAMWTVTSKRKYTGNYTLRFTMLNDSRKIPENNPSIDYYETTYMGMVEACRDYMEEKGILTRLTKDDVKEDIPLYIEAFGTATTQEKILSFPVEVQTPLTTFEDLKAMTEQLNAEGIENINYRLTGFFNGGLWATIPYNLEVEKNVGGAEGYQDFLSYASSKGIGVYPDFDFVWADAAENTIFDGLNRRQHLVKTMNTKYANMREYDPLYQQYMRSYMLAITPAYFSHFYDTFTENFKALNPTGISVSTLGEYLNSDFDKKDPYNREDNKDYTVELLARIKEEYGDVMTDAGNYYALPYVDHILNVPLDSSEYLNTSETIPFMGMVLHGYVNFAGMAMNNAGDMNYQILKAIENGAGIYFQLSYQNTEKLKTNGDFSKYYSIDFDIWFEDLVNAYNELNEAIADLQTKLIVDHEFVTAHRVLNDEEQAELQAEIDRLLAELEEKKAEEQRLKELEEQKKDAEEMFGKNDEEAAEGEGAEGEEAPAEDEEAAEGETEEEDLEEVEEEEEVIDMEARTLVDNGKVVRVEYEGGTVFFLNYNNFPVTVTVDDNGTEEDTTDDTPAQVEALSYIRIN